MINPSHQLKAAPAHIEGRHRRVYKVNIQMSNTPEPLMINPIFLEQCQRVSLGIGQFVNAYAQVISDCLSQRKPR